MLKLARGEGNEAVVCCAVSGLEFHHRGAVLACEFAPKGDTIVSGSSDKTLQIWDVALGTCQATLEGHSSCVNCVQFNPVDAGQLVSGSDDKTVKLWSVDDGQCLQTLTGHSGWVLACKFAPHGKTIVSASHDATLKI